MKISEEVLAVLSQLQIAGNCVALHAQLDRKMYVQVNKVLEALGGKWNRSAKAHIFPHDAQEAIDRAILVGEVTTHKDIGFFPTPPRLALRLAGAINCRAGHTLLEPSAGTGRLIEAALVCGVRERDITFVERDHGMFAALANTYPRTDALSNDFMDYHSSGPMIAGRFDRILMNPPFLKSGAGDHLDHTRLAYALLAPKGRLGAILPSGVLFRQDRRHAEFRTWAESVGQFETLPTDSFVESGTRVNTCMLITEEKRA